MTIQRSSRLDQVSREFYGYSDRRNFYRLDRNEDPTGWNEYIFTKLIDNITTYDFSAYSDSNELIEKLANWTQLSEKSIYITAGADGAIKNIFEIYLDPKDKILMQEPCWPMYWVYGNVYQANLIKQPYENNFIFDINSFIDKIETEKPRIVILANPNMPTGTMISYEDLSNIAKSCKKNDSLLIIDEAYHLFSSFTAVNLIKTFDNLIIVRTFSKAFGLAGLRIGYCLANQNIIKDLMLVRPIADANNIAMRTACFALDNIEYIKNRINDFNAGRDYLYNEFCKNEIPTLKSDGNFLLIGCRSMEKAKKALAKLQEKKYLLKGPYSSFPLTNYIRVTIGPLELMKKFWNESIDIIKESCT